MASDPPRKPLVSEPACGTLSTQSVNVNVNELQLELLCANSRSITTIFIYSEKVTNCTIIIYFQKIFSSQAFRQEKPVCNDVDVIAFFRTEMHLFIS